jgi:hypothetical protein
VERDERIMKAGHAQRTAEDVFEIELNINHRTGQKFCILCHELAHIFCGHLGTVEGLIDARNVTGMFLRASRSRIARTTALSPT